MDAVNGRPDYKSHPLWNEAMELAREAYSLAEELRVEHPEFSRRLRKNAVAVPARIAGALSCTDAARDEHVLAARGALAEVSRQTAREESPAHAASGRISLLILRAQKLDRAILFEFGVSLARNFS